MLRLLPLILVASPAVAHDARIEGASAARTGSTWTVSVTLVHDETGWDDYADAWRVVLEDGTVLGTRELLHPHQTEQPFTRSLAGVEVPPGVPTVFVEARTKADGWGTARHSLGLK